MIAKHTSHFIGGDWVASSTSDTIDVIDPATEQVIAQVPAGIRADIDAAVIAARAAFDTGPWPKTSGTERASYLRTIAKIVMRRLEYLADIEVRNNGKPLPEAIWDIEDVAGCFEYYAGLAENLDEQSGENVTLPDERFTSKIVKEPIGVAGAIIPWNFPLLMAAWKIAPALAAGCTMVLKPSEVTPLTALALADIMIEAGLPAGVLNIVNGYGAIAGQALTEHADVDKLAFTGSVPTGVKIMTTAARDIKNVSLELGGKSPFVIFEDSDLDEAVEWIMFGIFWNQGQVCSATSRVLVEQSIYPTLLEKLTRAAKKLR